MSVAWQVKYQPTPGMEMAQNGAKTQGTSNSEYGNWFSRPGRSSPIPSLARLQRNGSATKHGTIHVVPKNGMRPNVNGHIYDIPQFSLSANTENNLSDGKRFYTFISKANSDKDVDYQKYSPKGSVVGTVARRPVETPTSSPAEDRKLTHHVTRQVTPVRAQTDDSVLIQRGQRSPRSPRSPRPQGSPRSGGGTSLQRSHTMTEFDKQRRMDSVRHHDIRRPKTFHDSPTWRQSLILDGKENSFAHSPVNTASRNMLSNAPSPSSLHGTDFNSGGSGHVGTELTNGVTRSNGVMSATINSRHPIGWLGRDRHSSSQQTELFSTPLGKDFHKYLIANDAGHKYKNSETPKYLNGETAKYSERDILNGNSQPKHSTTISSTHPSRTADKIAILAENARNHPGKTYGGSVSLNGLNPVRVENPLNNSFDGQHGSTIDIRRNNIADNGSNMSLDTLMKGKATKSILKKKSSYDSTGVYDVPNWGGATTIRMGRVERPLPQFRGTLPYSSNISYFSEPPSLAEEKRRATTSGSGKRVTFAM